MMSLYGLRPIEPDEDGNFWKVQKKKNKFVQEIEKDLFMSAMIGE